MAASPVTVLLLQYNNYFNRTIKKENTVSAYRTGRSYLTDGTFNFNPNDGITTSIVIGTGYTRQNLEKMDYCVVHDSNNVILSRWFITEKVFTRTNQYEIFLRRDVIADNIQNVLSAKTFIEKGQIAATDTLRKPLLYNKESMTYNEIKSSETLLKDETNVPWIVGYIASNAVSASGASVDSTSTLGSTGTVNTNWNTYKLNVVCEKITLENTSIGSDPITAKPYSSGIENFEASYDPSTGMVHYAINLPGWANQNIKLVMYIVEPLPISADLTYPIEGAIESSSLPWTFDPTATNLSGLNTYRITPAILNVIGNNEYYRMIWPVTDFVPTSPTTCTKSTLVAKGNKTNWPTVFDPTTIWWMYTSHTNAGDGDWNTYGSDSVLEANVPVILPNVIVNNLRENGYSLTGDGLSVPDAYQYNNAIIHHGTKYYRLNVQPRTTSSVTISESHSNRAIFTAFANACATSASGYNTAATGSIITLNSHTPTVAATVDYSAELDSYALTITEISNSATIDTEIAPDVNRCHLLDAPYDMFAIPYDTITVTKTNAAFTPFQTDKDVSMAIALEASKDISTSKLYDIQLLPYCPCRYMINNSGQIDLSRGQEGVNYDFITETANGTTTNKSVILWASRSSDTFDINQTINMPIEDVDASLNIKINNECSKYRLVSPNFNGMFEFSVAKNGGSVSKFNVDYTYKPFSPYIHLNPDFQGLYGSDYDDCRGLILGGDFSLPMVNDAWVQYQVQNKNYQEIFDRQIQHMDVNNSIALDKQSFSSLMGTIGGITGGGISGVVGGAKAGGGAGAIAGAALGTIGGAVAGIVGGEMDRGFMYREQEEAKSYTVDMYGFSLGNIQATPYSLAKSSALTNNNKLFPIVEYYTCTTIEKSALKEKLIADGMSVMVIDQISNFIRNDLDLSFVRGSIVRLDTLADDSHLANEIYKEIKKGVYFTPNVGV